MVDTRETRRKLEDAIYKYGGYCNSNGYYEGDYNAETSAALVQIMDRLEEHEKAISKEAWAAGCEATRDGHAPY